jgi:hypothetical protein
MEPDCELWAAANRAAESLRRIPGVNGVGMGPKRTAGAITPIDAIRVFVDRKLPLSDVNTEQVVPREIDGYPTDVAVMTNFRYTAGFDPDPRPLGEPAGVLKPPPFEGVELEDCQRGLVAGDPVAGRVDSTEVGTIGPLLRDRSDPGKVYALTCYHILCRLEKGRVVERPEIGARVGQAKPNGCLSHCCNDCFGTLVRGDFEEDTWLDFALVQLDPGTRYLGAVKGIGPVPKGAGLFPGIARAPDKPSKDTRPFPYLVRKYGNLTQLSGGRVVDFLTGPASVSGLPSYIVAPHPISGKTYDQTYFSDHGDSGGPVTTPDGLLVGMIYAGFQGKAKDYYARGDDSPVHLTLVASLALVLDRLSRTEPKFNLEPAISKSSGDVHTVPPAPHLTAQLDDERVSVHLPPAAAASAAGQAGLPALAGELRAELAASTLGRVVLEVWQRHGPELYELVNHDRQVLATWHRSGASAVFQRLARARGVEAAALPRTVNGVPLRECLDRMHAVLAQQGGPELRAALDRLRARLPDLGGLTYRQVLAAFAVVPD